VIDTQWKDHLLSMDELKQGIGLRAHGQKDPLVEYKKESFELFQAMMDRIEDETVRYLYFLQVSHGTQPAGPYPEMDEEEEEQNAVAARPEPNEQQRQAAKSTMEDFTRNIQRKKDKELEQLQLGGDGSDGPKTVQAGAKVGRNDPCPCGSGKKYKKCHGS
jgi:preprotein translocase subunit SecA